MYSYLFAFLFGLLLPSIASRYGKIYASDLGEWLFFLWHKPHFPKTKNKKRNSLLKKKWRKMVAFSLFWAIFLMLLFILTDNMVPSKAVLWIKGFLCLMALLTVIDHQFFLLPDIFTVPLIFLGFGYALFTGIISPQESFFGTCYGFLLPAICVFITSAFFRDAFGGGDVKMLAGIGAWVGIFPLSIVILISVVSFSLTSFITKRHSNAYGPHLAFGSLIVLFLTIHHLIPFL